LRKERKWNVVNRGAEEKKSFKGHADRNPRRGGSRFASGHVGGGKKKKNPTPNLGSPKKKGSFG